MSAEVVASIEIPLLLQTTGNCSKDGGSFRHRPPFRSKQNRHMRALHRAMIQDDVALLETLLDHGISPNLLLRCSDSKSTTALHLAIESGNDRMTSLLLSRSANCNLTNDCGQTPLDVACKKRNFRVIDLLIHHGASLLLPSTRVACLGLTFFNLMTPSHDISSFVHVTSYDLDLDTMKNVTYLAYVLLDNGFARGWNGINCSFTYLNRVYNRHKRIFTLLLQAAHDCHDESFTESCFAVLYRRKDAETLLHLHRHGYAKLALGCKRTHKHTKSAPCRLETLTSPCPLMAMCRIKVRQTLRQNPGRISEKVSELTIPKCLQKYLGFV